MSDVDDMIEDDYDPNELVRILFFRFMISEKNVLKLTNKGLFI
jgi:hypothetical protein